MPNARLRDGNGCRMRITKQQLERVVWWLRDTAATCRRSNAMKMNGLWYWPGDNGKQDERDYKELLALAARVKKLAKEKRAR